jgi:hypothetical protein
MVGAWYVTVVLAVQRDALAASLSPVVATLRDIETRHGVTALHGLAPGLVVDDSTGWVPATALRSEGLTDLLDAAKQRWSAQPHAAAALAWKCYVYWVTLPALVGYAGAHRVPLPRPEDVLVRYSDQQPFLKVALHRPTLAVLASDPLARYPRPGIVVCADDAALLAELRRVVVDEHLTPLMDAIRERVHLGRRTLWGSLASGVAHGFARAADTIWPRWNAAANARPAPVLAMIDEMLRAFDVADLVDVRFDPATAKLAIDRRTCCLAFTLPKPKICTGCCIR